MIVTTTANVDGKKIVEYKGIVFGEVVSGVNVLKDFTAGMKMCIRDSSKGKSEGSQRQPGSNL